jgi:FkbM family methyltransferase
MVRRIGIFEHGWWRGACAALGHEAVSLPVAAHISGNAYAADVSGRIENGERVASLLAGQPTEFLLDVGGTGLGFVRGGGSAATEVKLAHEMAGRMLVSHFIDPLTTSFQGLDWQTVWQCVRSGGWVKAVWDRAQAAELRRFGVPNVMHLPMAAPNRAYDTRPLDLSRCRPAVSFVGGQNTSYFNANGAVPTSSLLPGTLAQSYRSASPDAVFCDVYHDIYNLAEPPAASDDVATQARKTQAYFNAKRYYHAGLCICNRDRYVIFLKRKLPQLFELVGRGWDTAYGLDAHSSFASTDDYFSNFRQVAVNLNLVNGNAETGLNMRHFEITAAGGFMLCHDQPELANCFVIGKECAVFANEADLLAKIQYYLSHPQERAAIAMAGQRRTLSQHLYSHRLQSILYAVAPRPLPVEYATTTWADDLRSLVPYADVVLDCGANVGQMATGLRRLYPDAEIYAFEPVRSVFQELKRESATIKVHPVCAAVADSCGKATIHLTTSHEANSLLDYQEGNPCAQWTWVVGTETVDTITLDEWCAQAGVKPDRVDVIKLDVQGAELRALYGARKLLRSVKAILLEVSFVPIYKDCPLFAEIDAFLRESGYRRHAVYPSDQPYNWGDALYIKA